MSYNDDEEVDVVVISYEKIYEIVKKIPKERTPDDIRYLCRLPVDIIKESINPYAILYARYLEYEMHKENKIIFASKSIKNGIYWVIQGSLGIFNKKNVIVRVYKNLDYFVQTDLINEFEDFLEVRALETTTVGFISDRSMTEIIQPLKKEIRWQLHDFLQCVPLFSTWSFNQIKMLLNHFDTLTFGKNTYVFQEKQESTAIFFIKEGQFDIRKNFSGAIDQEEKGQQEGIVIKDVSVSKLQKLQTKEFKISNLNLGDYFGEEDLLKKTKRTFSVMCTSLQGEVAYISSENFLEYIYPNLYTRNYIEQRIRKKEQMFLKREINIKESLSSYGKYLVNEHFNKNLDQIITEMAIQSQVKTYNEEEREIAIKEMQNHPHIQSISPSRQKGLIKNQTFSEIEELSDDAVAKMVQNNLFSKNKNQDGEKEDKQLSPEKQIIVVEDDTRVNIPGVVQNRVDELVRISKQNKQNYLYDWKGKRSKESPIHARDQFQRENIYGLEEYAQNLVSQFQEKSSYSINKGLVDDESSNSPTRSILSISKQSPSPTNRYNSNNSIPSSPKAISMTDIFKQSSDYPVEEDIKNEKIITPQLSQRISTQNTGRLLINVQPSMISRKENKASTYYQERKRGQFKSLNSTEQFTPSQKLTNTNNNNQANLNTEPQLFINKQDSSSPSHSQLIQIVMDKQQSSNESPLLPITFEKSQSKLTEKEQQQMKKFIEQVDDKFQSHHVNLTNQCQNFFTAPAQQFYSQKSLRTQLSSNSPDNKNSAYTQENQQLNLNNQIKLLKQQSSKRNDSSSSPKYKFNESPQQKLEQRISRKSSQNFINSQNPSQIFSSRTPRIQTANSFSNMFQMNLISTNDLQKSVSFADRTRKNVKGKTTIQPNTQPSNIYFNSSSPVKKGKSQTLLFGSNEQLPQKNYYKKSTLTDLYLSEFDNQQKDKIDNEQDENKSTYSIQYDEYNLNTAGANINNSFTDMESNPQLQSKNSTQNQQKSLERNENGLKNSNQSDVISRKLLFYKANTNYSNFKTSHPVSNIPLNQNGQHLSQKTLSERYQKYKLQNQQVKKLQSTGNTQIQQLSQQYLAHMDDFTQKQQTQYQSQLSSINNINTDKLNFNDLTTENFNQSKLQKTLINKSQIKEKDSISQNSSIVSIQKRAKSQNNVLPQSISITDFKSQKDQLTSPQNHLQKILVKKEKDFRKNLFTSSGNQQTLLQQQNNDVNNPYLNTYVQLDYMNAFKLSQTKNKNNSTLNTSTGISQFVQNSPEKKKVYDQSFKSLTKLGSINSHRQLVS